jgi:hypothetical protein
MAQHEGGEWFLPPCAAEPQPAATAAPAIADEVDVHIEEGEGGGMHQGKGQEINE